jgi:cell wall-associated NlpC family hydrolase
MEVSRRVLVLACLLLALLALPASAFAQDPYWDGPDPTFPDLGDLDPTVVGADPTVTLTPTQTPVPTYTAPATPTPAPLTPTQTPLVTTGTVAGKVARMRTDGKAAIPRSAPKAVRAIIAAANEIIGKPYKWGGGHAKLIDKGYDCSGTVSYALIRAGLLTGPLVSGGFAKWGAAGAGRWTTIYANAGHVYMEVAGLRLDTSAVGDPTGRSGVRWRPVIGKRPRFHVRHVIGL